MSFLTARSSLLAFALVASATTARPARAAWPHDPTVNVQIAPSGGNETPTCIVADGAGGAIVVWTDTRSGNYDIYAQHITSTGTVAPGWPANGLAICTAGGDQEEPHAVADGAGGAIIAWTDRRASPNGDIYAMRVTGAGTIPASWPVNGRQLLVDPNDESSPAIVSDGAGGALVAWEYTYALSDHDIYGAHVDASGTVLWANAVYQPLGVQARPAVVPDGAGGMVIG